MVFDFFLASTKTFNRVCRSTFAMDSCFRLRDFIEIRLSAIFCFLNNIRINNRTAKGSVLKCLTIKIILVRLKTEITAFPFQFFSLSNNKMVKSSKIIKTSAFFIRLAWGLRLKQMNFGKKIFPKKTFHENHNAIIYSLSYFCSRQKKIGNFLNGFCEWAWRLHDYANFKY